MVIGFPGLPQSFTPTRIIPRFLIVICCFHQQLCYQETVMQKLKCCLISCIWPSFLSQLSVVINFSLFTLQSMSARQQSKYVCGICNNDMPFYTK